MKKVLVVDDEADSLEVVRDLLEDEGYSVVTATDGEEAIKAARSQKPQLVVMDVQMPKMDGFTAFYEMRKDPVTSPIPVIILTGLGQKTGMSFTKEALGEYFGDEPQAYVEKPVDPKKLIAEVKKAIGPA
jgi:CheY-like chemotaxis protein